MELGTGLALLGAAGTVCSIIFAFVRYKRDENKDNYIEGNKDGTLIADTQYIKRRIDDVLLEQRDTNKSINALSERVTRVEESSKQAHKRLDRIEGRGDLNET